VRGKEGCSNFWVDQVATVSSAGQERRVLCSGSHLFACAQLLLASGEWPPGAGEQGNRGKAGTFLVKSFSLPPVGLFCHFLFLALALSWPVPKLLSVPPAQSSSLVALPNTTSAARHTNQPPSCVGPCRYVILLPPVLSPRHWSSAILNPDYSLIICDTHSNMCRCCISHFLFCYTPKTINLKRRQLLYYILKL
jgi:hypothetical protein